MMNSSVITGLSPPRTSAIHSFLRNAKRTANTTENVAAVSIGDTASHKIRVETVLGRSTRRMCTSSNQRY